MANALEPQEPRVGMCWYEGRPQGFPAMVWNTGTHIELLASFDRRDELRRRFIGKSARWGDDPDYSRYEYGMPEEVWFADTHGHVCLVGPYRHIGSLIGSPLEGRVSFRLAVFGGDSGVSYRIINRLRSR